MSTSSCIRTCRMCSPRRAIDAFVNDDNCKKWNTSCRDSCKRYFGQIVRMLFNTFNWNLIQYLMLDVKMQAAPSQPLQLQEAATPWRWEPRPYSPFTRFEILDSSSYSTRVRSELRIDWGDWSIEIMCSGGTSAHEHRTMAVVAEHPHMSTVHYALYAGRNCCVGSRGYRDVTIAFTPQRTEATHSCSRVSQAPKW